MKLKIKFSRHFGFTLVELLVVVAIMGILASVSYIGIQEVRKTIRDNKRRADLNEVARALELFKADYGMYPPNNYLSASYTDADKSLMPFLKDGGNVQMVYPAQGGGINYSSIAVPGGYTKDLIKDPINQVDSGYNGYMYAYYGAAWSDYSAIGDIDPSDFPIDCPNLDDGTCPDWETCCNSGCYNDYCDYNVSTGEISFVYYSMSTFSRLCYGDGSTRSMSVLVAKLEKESKQDERINTVLSFCPTANNTDPDNQDFEGLKAYFPRGKDCYSGDGNYGCSNEVNGTPDWSGWVMHDYNYFVPLTGEFNLR